MSIDGIAVGTIRSNLNNAKVSNTEWCSIFGHKYTSDKEDKVYCSGCFKTIDEINKDYYEQSKKD